MTAVVFLSAAMFPAVNAQASVVARWSAILSETSELLGKQDFVSARDRLQPLIGEIADSVAQPGRMDQIFAIALGQLAVAEAGAGDQESAIWHWQIAQNIDPSVRNVDLSGYSGSSDVLLANILPPTPDKCARPPTKPSPDTVRRLEPKYPKRARESSIGGLVIVELKLDAAGRPIQPHVIRTPLSALTYSTLIALREWRFAVPDPDAATEPFCRVFRFGPYSR